MERDLRLILAVQAVRAFLYGFGSVILGSVLASGGMSDARVGLVFTAMLAGMAIASIGVAARGERFGRRRLYRSLLLAMGAAGAVFALTSSFPLLVITSLTGTLSTDPNESGPITSLEQAMMGQAPASVRAKVFGRYNAVAYLAGSIGALVAGGPDTFREVIPSLPGDQRFMLIFPVLAIASTLLARRLSSSVEAGGTSSAARPLERSRSIVARLSLLFGLDSFAGGFIVQAFIVFWFHRKFGAGTGTMAVVFFFSGLLQAGSSVAAGHLAHRIGMLNTMVFTHLPSNVLLMAIPFAPSLGAGITLLLVRFSLSQMDVPARQAYVMAMVDPAERTAAAAYTNTARYVTRPAGPVAAAGAMQIMLGAPFLIAGALKIAYDLTIYGMFRKVPIPEDP